MLQFVVDTTGRAEPDGMTVVESTHPQFTEAVRRGAAALPFPARRGGRPKGAHARVAPLHLRHHALTSYRLQAAGMLFRSASSRASCSRRRVSSLVRCSDVRIPSMRDRVAPLSESRAGWMGRKIKSY